jgi:hypothetical protein
MNAFQREDNPVSGKKEPSGKRYDRPHLSIYGSLAEMTRGNSTVGKPDNAHGKGNNPRT